MSQSDFTEKTAYTNWVNVQLDRYSKQKNVDPPYSVSNIDQDFKSGSLTLRLAEALIDKPLHGRHSVRSEFQMMANNTAALEAIREFGCSLHGTTAKSLVEANKTMTRGFIYQLILYFQIILPLGGGAEMSIGEVRTLIIAKVNSLLATLEPSQVERIEKITGQQHKPLEVRDFSTSFNDGRVLLGLSLALNKQLADDILDQAEQAAAEDKDIAYAVTNFALNTVEKNNNIPILLDAKSIVYESLFIV